jgi:hypothetical protein
MKNMLGFAPDITSIGVAKNRPYLATNMPEFGGEATGGENSMKRDKDAGRNPGRFLFEIDVKFA